MNSELIFLLRANMNYLNNLDLAQEVKDILPNNVIVAFSNSRLNYDYRAGRGDLVFENRRNFFSRLGLRIEDAVFPMQVHGSNIVNVDLAVKGKGAFSFEQGIEHTDALITNISGIVLGLLSADCLPIVLCELNGKAIGLVHAGWKGISAGIIEKTIQAMLVEFKLKSQNIKAFFAPAIGSCCYEVGPEFFDIFPQDINRYHNSLFLDIKNIARKRCLKAGLLPSLITDVSICTKCSNERFFSYRCGDIHNRMLTIATILNE